MPRCANPDAFWDKHGRRLDWIEPYTRIRDTSFAPGNVHIRWFEDGVLNVAANCIDRHLATRGDQTAIIFEPDDPATPAQHITYRQLHDKVCRMANVLLSQGVMRGDRVVIYLPMIPEAAYAMLACARIGAIHSVVFAGFSPDALANRINDCGAKLVITADTAPRGGRRTGTEIQHRRRASALLGQGPLPGGQAHRRPDHLERRSRRRRQGDDGAGGPRLPAAADEGRRPAVHPLHLGLDRQAEGRGAYLGRLSGLCRDDPRIHLRLP